MTTANSDFVRLNKNDVATALAALSLTTADDLHVVVQGSAAMFIKQENVRGLSSESIASLVQIEYKHGSDLSGSDLVIDTTSVWNTCLVFKSGAILHSDDFSTSFATLTATITFGITVYADEDIVIVGIK